ncbi:MAG: potassium transporter TrkH [Lachnospiraceae bacterium]|nr:potassium transporter TrkH [Lachnospiraceae bacterium]
MRTDGRRFRISSEKFIPLGFLVLILAGTFLLMLPFSTADGQHTSFLTALFTATTSTCVTGLVVVDTFSHWSVFGQIVILILIQFGGLGIIAVTSSVILILKKKFSLREKLLIRDAFALSTGAGLVKFLLRVLRFTFVIELIGMLLYLPAFLPEYGFFKGLWVSLFTSVSAFCNAGLDVIGPNSLVPFCKNPLMLIVTMFLIVAGGLGYVVWFDFQTNVSGTLKKKRSVKRFLTRLSEHTKLVLVMTSLLILIGAAGIFIMEYGNPETLGGMSFGNKILNSLFQSVTFRTAGFSTVPQESLTSGSGILGMILMFIGGSPVGTAGGVKTVTVALLFLNAVSFIRNRKETVVFNRNIPETLIRKATAIVSISLAVTLVLAVALAFSNGLGALDSLYETVSATATVGLSRAVTPGLNVIGRLIIILCMFFGRIGPITMALFFGVGFSEEKQFRHADGDFFAG